MSNNGLLAIDVRTSDSTLPAPHAISHRRKIGAFYTPLNVAELLCKWAVRNGDDVVLEPCFGGCTFLEALCTALGSVGKTRPSENIYGCDNDPLAFEFLEGIGHLSEHPDKFVLKDFLTVSDFEIPKKFDAIVGNPPYIRHSKFDNIQRDVIAKWSKKYGIELNGRSSLWAYFILHAMHFLKPGGRVAWVLPLTFLTSAYAGKVREIIARSFNAVTVITLTERLFIGEGTEEPTVILLAEGFKEVKTATPIYSYCVDTVAEMAALIEKITAGTDLGLTIEQHGTGVIPIAAITSFESFKPESASTLKDWATVKIGLVTGDVPFFIKAKKDWDVLGISSEHLQYIAPKAKWIRGIDLSHDDAAVHISDNIPCLALNCPSASSSVAVSTYLASYNEDKIRANSTFRKREVWHYFFDDKIPDAFLAFMTHLGPRMILNGGQKNCTNSLYRVFFNENLDTFKRMLITISLQSTYSQFSAELLGQGRGAGALKLDPSHSLSLKLVLPTGKSEAEVNEAFLVVDSLLRADRPEDARKAADQFIFGGKASAIRTLAVLEQGLQVGRARRMQVSRKLNRSV